MAGNTRLAAGRAAAAERWLARGVRAWLGDLGDPAASLYPRRLKALCETSFLEICASVRPSRVVRTALLQALGSVRVPDLLSLLRHNLVHSNLLLPVLAALAGCRRLRPGEREDVARLLPLCARYSKERLPFRQLDLLHALYRVGGGETWFRELISAAHLGCLGRLRFAHDADPRDDYAVTHTVFYVTDFGRRGWPRELPALPLVDEVLDLLSWRAQADRNLDLLAEYALCRLCLGRRGRRLEEEVTILLDSWETAGGFWRGPADLGEILEGARLCPAEREFFEHYHTTLLAKEVLRRWSRGEAEGVEREPRPPVFAARTRNVRFWLPPRRKAGDPRLAALRDSYTELALDVAAGRPPSSAGGALRFARPELGAYPVELAYWRTRAGGAPLRPRAMHRLLASSAASEEPAELRRRLLARLAAGLPADTPREARALFDRMVRAARNRIREEGGLGPQAVDPLVIACLLAPVVVREDPLCRDRLAALLRDALSLAAAAREAGRFAELLAYGLPHLPRRRSAFDSWLDFLTSMSAASLPFGWTTHDGPLHAAATAVQEIQALQAVLALVLSRRLTLADLARRPPGPALDRRPAAGARPPSTGPAAASTPGSLLRGVA